jgi:hypothetical protein
VVTASFGSPLSDVGGDQQGGGTLQNSFGAAPRDESQGTSGGRFDTCRAKSFDSHIDLTAFVASNDAPHGKVFTIVEQQMIASTTDLTDCAPRNLVRTERIAVSDVVKSVTAATCYRLDRGLLDFEVLAVPAWPRDAVGTISKVNDRTIAQINAMVLKRDTTSLSPYEKVFTSSHRIASRKKFVLL